MKVGKGEKQVGMGIHDFSTKTKDYTGLRKPPTM